jgi:putative NIF3 family GTP cyclohydrolase 1 type 2
MKAKHVVSAGLVASVLTVATLVGQTAATRRAGAITAKEIVARIKSEVTCSWQKRTVDTFKAGDPDTVVTGVATTFMATYDVLERAKRAGCNFIITHEPTFYNHLEDTSAIEPDAIIKAKRRFIEDHGLVVWRFHDHIHRTEPDGILTGMIDVFGWKPLRTSADGPYFELPAPSSVQDFAAELKAKSKHAVIRVVGDPDMQFTRFGFAMGAPGSIAQMKMLQRDDVEVLVAGETCEWETVEYVRDAKDMGRKKALIILGHAVSEEAGMKHCAEWLRDFVTEVPVQFIAAGDPFWTP